MMRHVLVVAVSVWSCSCSAVRAPAAPWRPPEGEPTIERVAVPGTTVELEFVRLRGAADSGRDLCVARTEMTWALAELFHTSYIKPERMKKLRLDAVTRPTVPYVSPLHDTWGPSATRPAMYISSKHAKGCAHWLSLACERPLRLPTESEWDRLCTAVPRVPIGRYAWTAVNAGERAHDAGTLDADGLGLFDLQGNVSEWVVRSGDVCVLKGASYADADADANCVRAIEDTVALSDGDPQDPKSEWWRVGAPWAGFRLVYED